MKQDKQDRRSRRTRQLVSSAMLELLNEKRYEAITVQDILDRSGVGRSTFYSHYYDKDDVHAAMMEQMLDGMSLHLLENTAQEAILPSLELFQHIRKEPQLFHAMAEGSNGQRMWEMMQTALAKNIEQALLLKTINKGTPSIPISLASSYLAGAFLNLIKWWLKASMPYTPEEMDGIFRQLALPGVWDMLNRNGDIMGQIQNNRNGAQ